LFFDLALILSFRELVPFFCEMRHCLVLMQSIFTIISVVNSFILNGQSDGFSHFSLPLKKFPFGGDWLFSALLGQFAECFLLILVLSASFIVSIFPLCWHMVM